MIAAGLQPTAAQVAANIQAIEANRQGIAANRAELASQKDSITTNEQTTSSRLRKLLSAREKTGLVNCPLTSQIDL